ncbi:cytochrome c oxidase assembly protein [bacterium]|jgi:cytochrome c oxidase assembly protein subunit 11|nr:cytochrome c oxidase assembly protein [bacterium]NBW56582.1 cytochrome c oxidase assembly protein [bacterium]NBX71575.1 cytochrome c oxidase assembly protein [bacterium]
MMPHHSPLIKRSILAIIMMFAFSFCMVPLYNALCKATGIDGKGLLQQDSQYTAGIDVSRLITIEFDSNVQPSLNFLFYPSTKKAKIHPGEPYTLYYHMNNLTSDLKIVQAIPSVAPPVGSKFIKKLECFCFQYQDFYPYQSLMMPLRIVIDPELPSYIHTLTLSYTLFDLSSHS